MFAQPKRVPGVFVLWSRYQCQVSTRRDALLRMLACLAPSTADWLHGASCVGSRGNVATGWERIGLGA